MTHKDTESDQLTFCMVIEGNQLPEDVQLFMSATARRFGVTWQDFSSSPLPLDLTIDVAIMATDFGVGVLMDMPDDDEEE